MKKLLTLSALVALGSFANAQEAAAPEAVAEKCPTQCASACTLENSEGTLLKIAVTGLDKAETAMSTEGVLGAQAAIVYCKTCPKSGTVTVKYNPEKTKVADIEKVLTDNGLKINGHKTAFKIKGLACQTCSNHLTTVLGKADGVLNVDKVCHMSGHAEVTFDPKKTDADKLKAAIHTTKYKVVEAAKKPATKTAPAA